jgi:hypothetical protein
VTEGQLDLAEVRLAAFGSHRLPARRKLAAGGTLEVRITRDPA